MWPYFTIALQGLTGYWNTRKIIDRFHEIFHLSAMILYALSTHCNRLVEETFPAPKSQKNKWEAEFVNINFKTENVCNNWKELEKKYSPALDNYRQSCFVRSDLKKKKCVCKTQMICS